jgi:hypothetical protein
VSIFNNNANYSSPCDSEDEDKEALWAAIDDLRDVGIPTVICTGNNGNCDGVSSPACISNSVTVGSTLDDDRRDNTSNWHATMQSLFAPGVAIHSATFDSDTSYANHRATSFAAPHVAGAWALMKQARPEGTVTDFLTILKDTGVDITTSCDNYTTAIPRIQVDAAINFLLDQSSYVYFDDFNRSDDANLDGDPLSGNPYTKWDAYNAQVVSSKARPNLKIDSIMKADFLMLNIYRASSIIFEADALVMEPLRTFYMGFPNIENGNFGNYGFTLWLEVDYNGMWRIKTRAYGVTNTLRNGQFSGWITNSRNHYKLDCHIPSRTVDFYFNGLPVASNIYVSTPVSLSRAGFQIKRGSGLLGPWQGDVDNFKVTLEY